MFDDLTLEQLEALRTEVRTAWQSLITGKATAEIRYGEMGQKFHPANPDQCEKFLGAVNTAISKRKGCGSGAIFPVTG